MTNELTRELEWFLYTLLQDFGVEVTPNEIATEAVELGIDEVDHFFIPNTLLDNELETLLYEIMVTDDEEGNEWVGAIAFYQNSPEWFMQVITKMDS